MRMLRMGMIGFGAVAQKHHYAAYGALAGEGAPLKLVAVCDQREENILGIEGVGKYTDWRKMILEEKLDAVQICLPTFLHEEVSCECLAAGLHVLCEKPMALCEASAGRMVQAMRASGKVLMVGMPMRFFAPYLLIEELVKGERLGKVRTAYFTRSSLMPQTGKNGWMLNPSLSGGVILDVMIHDLDAVSWLFGVPDGIHCSAQRISGYEVFGSASARLTYEDGRFVTLIADWLPYYNKHGIRMGRVDFERGYVYFDMEQKSMFVVGEKGEVEDRSDVIDGRMYIEEIKYFAECVLNGEEPVRCRAEDSMKSVGLCEQANVSRG